MRPWDCLDYEAVPHNDGTLYLMSRGSEFVIHVDGRELMSNRMHGSEDALADFAIDRMAPDEDAQVLVGGLGMGFTLSAVLRRLGPNGRTTVAELMPAVVRWNEEYVGKAAGYPLRDPRVDVYVGDVGDLVENPPTRWSAILLDVDNGPNALTRPSNGWLYTPHGLASARDALREGGVLGIWSAATDDSLTERLVEMGFEVERLPFTEYGRPTKDDSGTHILWMARVATEAVQP
ncbi:MAG: spermidine synthase [Myxococcota bacterium]|jgi:spermidine synthase